MRTLVYVTLAFSFLGCFYTQPTSAQSDTSISTPEDGKENSNAKPCTGESWTDFIDGACQYYVHKPEDERNASEINKAILKFNTTRKSQPQTQNVPYSIVEFTPKPDPDSGLEKNWEDWLRALDRQIIYYPLLIMHCGPTYSKASDRCEITFTVSSNGEISDLNITKGSDTWFAEVMKKAVMQESSRLSISFPYNSKRTSVTVRLRGPGTPWQNFVEGRTNSFRR